VLRSVGKSEPGWALVSLTLVYVITGRKRWRHFGGSERMINPAGRCGLPAPATGLEEGRPGRPCDGQLAIVCLFPAGLSSRDVRGSRGLWW
jgi:hypothetical protein